VLRGHRCREIERRSAALLGVSAALLVLLVLGGPAAAEQDMIATERSLLEVIQSERMKDNTAQGRGEESDSESDSEPKTPKTESQGESTQKRPWAILPQIGLSPEKGASAGVKFTNRDMTALHLTLDVSVSAAVEGQQHLDTILISPEFGTDWLMLLAEGEYYVDPAKEFFGLGNNDVGPDELSTNRHRRLYATLGLGVRLSRRFTLVVTGAFNDVEVSRGKLQKDGDRRVPPTTELFPSLAGIDGGRTNPLSIAVLFNDRQQLARPTRGWSIIAKATWVPDGLGNDFNYTRLMFDASYLYPLLTSRQQVLGLHLGGQYIDSRDRGVPFYELASLGGSRDLRGYFEDRFLGDSNFMVNGEYRLKVLDFDFFEIWHVQIDGVAFGDVGRVFFSSGDLRKEYGDEGAARPPTNDDIRYSYGGGTRIALGQALVARIDVGFSDEEKGLIYLVFGHTF